MSNQTQAAWSKPPLIKSPVLRYLVVAGVLVYIVTAVLSFGINPARIARGLGRAGEIFGAFLRPDFISRGPQIWEGVIESIAMTVGATAVGVLISIPLSLGAASNISPLPVYLLCRAFLVTIRSLHVVVLAILFVIMLGFGPFAGALTLVLNSVGFIGKLLSEEIENIDDESLEAVRATGATWSQVVVFSVWPQVVTRVIGISIYRMDINFRQSTVIGLVGAGGIGAVLDTAMGRYDYNTAAGILIVIIGLVLGGEYLSSAIRRRLT